MKLTNAWNKTIYRIWAPIYDVTVNLMFLPGRKQALKILNLQPGERVLIVGVGTGADLPFLPAGIKALGIDYSPDMLAKARAKLKKVDAEVELLEGDAQTVLVPDASFDAAILNLILSVVPDGNACLQTTLRALKPGSRAVIFDKFSPSGGRPSPFRRLFNFFSTLLGTDITRSIEEIMMGCDCTITYREPSIVFGMYTNILIRKNNHQSTTIG